ncbi:extracellular solute-binding protein [Zafaria sp. Z1313]|uniref:ABC transporter substrate-binding protein n=1 Tax=unclassified Zafaria TaxID=2828765 RepID=UPI002E781932|nr:extracellular solute-binding protein [Zafaria sp. J156]MEE1622319.1 extracellular solute-binding protein [Zafaria sp. J156]
MPVRTNRSLGALAGASILALGLVSCGGSGGTAGTSSPGADGSPAGDITLTVATFNEFGYEELLTEYMDANPGVKIEHTKAATTDQARDNMNTRLAAGSGLADIEAVEVDWLPELKQYPDLFNDLASPETDGRWLDWKTEDATVDGKLIGYGTDIGPEGICYRADLFDAAGLPTDRDEVAELLTGDWDHYFSVGRDFTASSEAAWFDSAGATFQGMVNQLEQPFENPDGTPIPLAENTGIKDVYEAVLRASIDDGLSANLEQWGEDWTSSFQRDAFATMLCPGWMLGVVEGNAAGIDGWDFADVFPGGGGNWGGSYLTVPTQTAHQEEAIKLAAWLTAPEQQIKAFQAKGTFPSQVDALTDETLLSEANAFFNDAPTGQILSERAKAVTVTPFKGPNYFAIRATVTDALTRVDVNKTDDADSSWQKALDAYQALGL